MIQQAQRPALSVFCGVGRWLLALRPRRSRSARRNRPVTLMTVPSNNRVSVGS